MKISKIIDGFREKIDDIKYEIRSYGYSFFEHPELEALIRLARNDYFETYLQIAPHAPTHKFGYSDLEEKKYWKKFAIGSSNGTGAPYAQFLVTTYVTDRGDLNHLQLLFNLLFRLRNLMIGLPRDFGANPKSDMYWNASRVHTYPAGGGFMLGHTDTHFLKQIDRKRTEYELLINDSEFHVTHVSCPLSLRGQDFEQGGFWIKDRRTGEKLFLEKFGDQLNKLLIFDGYCEHGIDSVDPDKLLDLSTVFGRTACLSNLYAFD
jgi:hypothetical protein